MENYLQVETESGPMSVFCSSPASSETRPVVIVLQEAFGVNDHIKGICRKLSEGGYVALAPELYHRTSKHLTIDYAKKEGIYPELAKLNNENILMDLRATCEFLSSLPSADPAGVFLLGFCIGGFAALLGATELNLRGVISFYGAGVVRKREGIGVDPFLNKLSHSRCPLLLFYGEKDVSIPMSDRYAIQASLDEAHIPHTIHVFSEADHGFFCPERKVYDEAAATRAFPLTLEFLRRHSLNY